MKRLYLTLIILTFAIAGFAQDEFFNRYEGKPNVDVVFISKSMLAAIEKKGNSISQGSKQFEALRIMEVNNKSLIPSIKEDAMKSFSNSEGYEDLMRLNESGETTIIRQKKLKNSRSVFILINYSESSLNVLALTGKGIQLNDIKKMR